MILLRIFKNNRSAGVAGIVILSLAIFVKSFITGGGMNAAGIGPEAGTVTAMPFYNLIFGAIHTIPTLDRIITLLILWVLCYMLNRIGSRDVLLDSRSLMPSIFFILFSMVLPETHHVTPALSGSLFYLFCFAILFEIHDKRPDTFTVFTAGLILALGSMFYLKLIWFIPLIWISLVTMRSVTFRELLYPVVAYILLFLFLFTWYWVVLDDGMGFVTLLRENLSFKGSFTPHHYSAYIYYGYCLLLIIVASIYMINRFQARKTVIQNIYQVLFYMFIAGILFFIFIGRFDNSSLVYIGFPVAYILSNYFHRKKNPWTHELALWIVIGLLVYIQWMA